MRTLYLHVGQARTATSSLQTFFITNRQYLKKLGIYYPKIGMTDAGVHYHLVNSIKINKDPKFDTDKEIKEYISGLQHETGGYSNILLSSESFSHKLDISKLNDLRQISDKIKIIIYLRRQDYRIESFYAHLIGNGKLKSDFKNFSFIERVRDLNLQHVCDYWADIFGKENIIIRIYEKNQFISHNIYSDFLSIFNVSLDKNLILPKRRLNISLGRDELEYKRLFNYLSDGNEIMPSLRARTYGQKSKLNFIPYRFFSPTERESLLGKFRMINEYVAHEYLLRTNGQLFYEPVCNEPWVPYDGLSHEKIFKITEFIYYHNLAHFNRIVEAVKHGLESQETDVRSAATQLAAGVFKLLNKKSVRRNMTVFDSKRLLKKEFPEAAKRIINLKQKVIKLEEEIESIKRSRSFRLGRFLMMPLIWLYEKFKILSGNRLNLFSELCLVILRKPILVMSLLNMRRINTLRRALKHEEPQEIVRNFVGLVKSKSLFAMGNSRHIRDFKVQKSQPKSKYSSGSILFISHDARLAGAQILLKGLMEWFDSHTAIEMKLICIEGGVLLPKLKQICPTIVWNDFYRKHDLPSGRITELKRFCGHVDLIYGNTCVVPDIYDHLLFLKAPILTHVHEMEKGIKSFIPDYIIKNMRKYSDAYIACSTPVEEYLVKNNYVRQKPYIKIHSFINLSAIHDKGHDKSDLRKKLGLKEDAFIVIGCGTIYWRKGTDLFIDTAIKLRQHFNKSFHFYWMGTNYWDGGNKQREFPDWESLEKRIEENKVADLITFLGVKQNPREYFLAADVFYLPSREDPIPLVCLEAAECRLPLVCFDEAGGIPEFIGTEAGITVPYEDTDRAAESLAYLGENETARIELGMKARQNLLQGYTVDTAGPKVLEFIGSVSSIKTEIKEKMDKRIPRFHRKRSKAVIVTHLADLSGAPQIILKITEVLHKEHGVNCVILSMEEGILLEKFANFGDVWIVDGKKMKKGKRLISEFLENHYTNFDFALVNTACCVEVMQELKKLYIPIITFIHDYTYAWNTNYLEALYSNSDHIIYSVQYMLDKNMEDFPFEKEEASVIPQGLYKEEFLNGIEKLDRNEIRKQLGIPEKAFLVMGCGIIHMRKGIDVFINTAIQTIALSKSNNIYFLWLGGELSSDSDDMYVRFLQRDLINSGASERIKFIPSVEDVLPYYVACDLFFLSSREDPFPTVVLESFAAGLPVIGIEGSTGALELLRKSNNFTIPYIERGRIPELILDLMKDPKKLKEAGEKGKKLVLEEYKFDDYVLKIKSILTEKFQIEIG